MGTVNKASSAKPPRAQDPQSADTTPAMRAHTLAPQPPASASTDAQSTPRRDSVLEVLERELSRSMQGFRIPGSPRPYYMHYALRRTHSLRLRAMYGSLTRARETTHSSMFCDLRVGSHKFDNILDAGLDQRAEDRESTDWTDAPDDLNLAALQVALWKLSQIKYDEALADYYDHKKAMVSEYLRDEVTAFTKEKPLDYREPLSSRPFPRLVWETNLRELSRRFLDHPKVHDPIVAINAERVHRWLATTEGTRVVTEEVYLEVMLSGWVLTEDGVYTEASRELYLRGLDEMPDRAALEAMLDTLLAELSVLREAETPGAFIGPALLSGQAASTLFHEALGHRLEGDRLVARDETRTFAHKVGKRILPEAISVYDDPTLETFDGRSVWGSYRVDDQGVRAQRASLVEDGVLRGFLHGRTPTPHNTASNGHGRHDGLELPMSRMANLVVEARGDGALSREALEEKLLETARAQGRKEAMIIERIQGGETSTQAYDFQVFKGEPAEVYRIDVETGEKTRVRDVELIGTPLAALQRIIAVGVDLQTDQGYCYAESGSIPVSGIAPALLLSELEMQQSSTTGFHEPLLPPPFADDG
ncbi:MAG: metallopeptidase TldD-related protein, partial [Myxococcota bacterium]